MTAWQKEQLGVKCIYCWRGAFCATVTWNREVADCDLRCALRSSQSCRQGCQLCSPQKWHTTFITAWVRHGESSATAACCCSCLLARAERRADPSPWHASLVSSWCNRPTWKSNEKLRFYAFFLRKKKINRSFRILTLNLIIIIRDQPRL